LLDNWTEDDYYEVTAVDFVSGSSSRTGAADLEATGVPIGKKSLLDLDFLDLGKIFNDDANPVNGEYVEYVVKFFSKDADDVYTQLGEDLVFNVLVNANDPLFVKHLVATANGVITESAEAGSLITIKAVGDTFVAPIAGGNQGVLDDVTITAQPTASGLSIGSVTYVDANTIIIKIAGDSVSAYDLANETLTFTVAAAGLTGAANLTASITLANNTAPIAPTINRTGDSVSVSDAKTITLTFGANEVLYNAVAAAAGDAFVTTAPFTSNPGVVKVYTNSTNTLTGATELTWSPNVDNPNDVATKYTVGYNSTTRVFAITIGANLAASTFVLVVIQPNKIWDAGGNVVETATYSFRTA
jgi:hypothetical protein